ncbi:RNA polymerase sigma factor [Pirellula sp. SH-Sr6A]|uniref:RNA polymerase sigma factor n=1 Tax=Pirellula sp. SH-Sr6A TaxID=1632865 RepID=UPI00078E3059|nr:sigma-70 family RNA polymerase sigma factor [Pirellula sp. SH-Sr6A]AMV32426.1 RNA polymerase sigma factor [Pirellula sp. SH-Sr6A]
MASSPERPLPLDQFAAAHAELRPELVRFAWGVLRDWALADDAVQNGFVALARFGGDVEPTNRKSWLYKVVLREAIGLRKGSSTRRLEQIDTVGEPAATYQLDPAQNLLDREESDWIRRQLKCLPVEQQEVLDMRIKQEMTFAEISQQLGIPIGTALSRMRLALQKLRELSDDR